MKRRFDPEILIIAAFAVVVAICFYEIAMAPPPQKSPRWNDDAALEQFLNPANPLSPLNPANPARPL